MPDARVSVPSMFHFENATVATRRICTSLFDSVIGLSNSGGGVPLSEAFLPDI
jgi:hypothetical protein